MALDFEAESVDSPLASRARRRNPTHYLPIAEHGLIGELQTVTQEAAVGLQHDLLIPDALVDELLQGLLRIAVLCQPGTLTRRLGGSMLLRSPSRNRPCR